MAIQYFVAKPPVVSAVQWTGDNLPEITALVGSNRPVNETGDGTLTTGGGWFPTQVVQQGEYVDSQGNRVSLNDYQEVPAESVAYVVE